MEVGRFGISGGLLQNNKIKIIIILNLCLITSLVSQTECLNLIASTEAKITKTKNISNILKKGV